MENLTIKKVIDYTSPKTETEVSMNDMPKGFYAVIVKAENNFIYSTKIYKN